VACAAVTIDHVHDAAALERHVRAVFRFAQREGDIISSAEMFGEQRFQRDVGQEIAAVRNEMLGTQQRFDVLDPAACPEDFRLVNQLNRMAAISSFPKQLLERRRAMMRVDDERFHAGGDEMIEHKCDERLLENRDKRLWQILGEGTEPGPESGTENECLRDHLLEPPPCGRRERGKASGSHSRASHSEAARGEAAATTPTLVILDRSDKTCSMAEETIWRGTSSQLKNLGFFILCVLFCWLIVPIFIGLTRYLQTKNQVFELTSERLKMTEGIFSKVTETLELYRVKDIEVLQPFWYRILGLENIKVNTSDLSSPVILLDGIPQKIGLADKMRNQVETVRMQKKVREIDIE
jgi:membrane protein YdbS with pleckstrin-like domain